MTPAPRPLGKARIKVEFWRVNPEYLAQYSVELRSPIVRGALKTVADAIEKNITDGTLKRVQR